MISICLYYSNIFKIKKGPETEVSSPDISDKIELNPQVNRDCSRHRNRDTPRIVADSYRVVLAT